MRKGTFRLSEFQAEVFSGAGLARTNRFEVFILPPPVLGFSYGAGLGSTGRFISLYVESASFPMLSINTKQFKIFGPAYQRPMHAEFGGEGIPITFHVDRNMNIKRFFDDWMSLVVNIDSGLFSVNYQDLYASKVLIKQIDEQNNLTYEIELLEAFPRNINLMELNNASSNQTHRLTVLFAYRYWRKIDSSVPAAELTSEPPPRFFFPDSTEMLGGYEINPNATLGNLDGQPGGI